MSRRIWLELTEGEFVALAVALGLQAEEDDAAAFGRRDPVSPATHAMRERLARRMYAIRPVTALRALAGKLPARHDPG